MKKLYDQREVSRLIGISESQIRYWHRQGLVPHRERQKGRLYFDFQGLVALRTVKELRQQGVSLGKIKRCLERLKRIMPETARPLSEVRISMVKDQIILGKDSVRFTPEGQLLLDFSAEVKAPIPLTVEVEEYEELFFQALDDEEEEKWAEARQKYEAILAAQPEHADSLVNLGNILHRLGAPQEAAAHYRRALGINPDHVEANYNLANLLSEQGDLDNATLFYQKAIHEDPEFAAAHFHLAMVLEALGDLSRAKKHWQRYLELDPDSEWADYIKRLLD